MGKTYNLYCDYCKKVTTTEGIKKEELNGYCAEIGYSINGWGKRNDFVPKQDVEICDTCFKELKEKSVELNNLIRKLSRQ